MEEPSDLGPKIRHTVYIIKAYVKWSCGRTLSSYLPCVTGHNGSWKVLVHTYRDGFLF